MTNAGGGAPVRFDGVTVRYATQARAAVDNVSFDVAAGEFVVLLGPSGCGKSTLLRTVNRLVEPHSGHVFVDGSDVAQVDPVSLRRGIGYVIQAVGLFTHLTIAQNIAVVPSLLHWEKARIAQRVDELLRLVDLDPEQYRGRYPHELSGGEQQRAGVARAIAAQPRVLLMDEPFGALDAIVRATLQRETKRIAQRLRTTILFVTHDVEEALLLADRIAVMRAGRLVQIAAPLELLTQPADGFVEELLDTHDVVRRLQLLRARDAVAAAAPPASGDAKQIPGDATLREALNLLLEGTPLAIERDGRRVALTLADVQRAIAARNGTPKAP